MRFTLGERGLTLLEALVAAMLLSLIIMGSLLLFERGVRTWCWTEQEAEVVDNLRIAVDRVVYSVRREATKITYPDPGVENETTLTFERQSAEPNVVKETVTYRVADQQLKQVICREWKTDPPGTTQSVNPVTTDVVEAVYFSRPEPALVKIQLSGKGGVSVRTAAYADNLQ